MHATNGSILPLRLEGIEYRVRGRVLLDSISATLGPGTRTVILGPNGAGKSLPGTKIVLTTQDLGQARRLADEILFLHRGRLLEVTPAVRFFVEPRSEAAGSFLRGEVGSGQAFVLGRRGDVDVLLVHDRPAEEAFVAEGAGIDRRDVMYNDFVLVGPRADPAGVCGLSDAPAALAKVAAAKAPFASRGDGSGTHQAGKRLWQAATVDPSAASGTWYRETGSGMGATLNTAAGMAAYTLADRATWDMFGNRGDFELLVEGDPRLRNPYAVILVNPAHQPHVKAAAARRFADWLTSADGQAAIGAFRKNGPPLFVPSAAR